jgi:hypothetical protein
MGANCPKTYSSFTLLRIVMRKKPELKLICLAMNKARVLCSSTLKKKKKKKKKRKKAKKKDARQETREVLRRDERKKW